MGIYIAQLIGMSALTFCYVPQIVNLYKTKSAEGQMVWFWRILSIGLAANVYISLFTGLSGGGWQMFILQSANTTLSVWTLILVEIYGRREAKDAEGKRRERSN